MPLSPLTRTDGTPDAAYRLRTVTLIALSLTFGLVQLDATIVNVALQTLRTDLGGGVDAAQWAVDAYAVPFAALLLPAGAIGDRWGHRLMCVAGFVLFGLASVAAALATGWAMLITARAVQGVGAAAMLPASLAVITRLFPDRRERSRALGVWGGVATLGFAAGPLVGGLLITHLSWPAIFWLNLPVAVVVGGTIAALAPADQRRTRHIDPAGALLGVLALAAITAGLIEAGQRAWPATVVLLVAGAVASVLFVVAERRATYALVPSEMVGSAAFRWALATGFGFNFAMYGALLCVSLVLQGRFGFSPMAGGLAVLPMAVIVAVGSTASGHVAAVTGPRRPMLAGFGCAGLGALVIAAGALASSPATIITGLAVIGLCSLAMPAMTSVALDAAPPEHAGLAGGSLNTTRQVGGAVGVALLGAVLNAGGDRTGFAVALVVAAVTCAGSLVSTVRATR
ncbi:MAG: MFS transporter [Nocardioides sp.]|nr:MFS transporter [Nocardioides sp.]